MFVEPVLGRGDVVAKRNGKCKDIINYESQFGEEDPFQTLLEGNPYLGFPSDARSAPCHSSEEH